MSKKINDILEESKNLYDGVVIVGVRNDGSIDLRTNIGDIFQIQGILTEAGHELFLFKKQSQVPEQESKLDTVESIVEEVKK